MNWEALSAISTAFTGIVILVTAIYAARQVHAINVQSKTLADQVEHLRRATQLDGTLAVFEEIFAPDFMMSYQFVASEFEERYRDARFHEEAVAANPDPEVHRHVPVLRHMERIGTLIKNGLLDGEVVLDFAGPVVAFCWDKLRDLALEQRERSGDAYRWENFEYIAAETKRIELARAAGSRSAAGERIS